MNAKSALVLLAVLANLAIYLFISAPPPLTDSDSRQRQIPLSLALEILQKENEVVREIYTRDIVGEGKRRGIKFDENWQDNDVHAGPLPAQFLRETARFLEQKRIQLGLFLVSDFSINTANNVEGEQRRLLQRVRDTRKPQMSYVADAERYAYMFPDVAVVEACTECHNKHPETPKTDWKLNDVMGATTWTFPNEHISIEMFFDMLVTLRAAVTASYQTVLEEISAMPDPPKVGAAWPRDGYFLPEQEVFTATIVSRASSMTLQRLSEFLGPLATTREERVRREVGCAVTFG